MVDVQDWKDQKYALIIAIEDGSLQLPRSFGTTLLPLASVPDVMQFKENGSHTRLETARAFFLKLNVLIFDTIASRTWRNSHLMTLVRSYSYEKMNSFQRYVRSI